jgi:hypothetical protein
MKFIFPCRDRRQSVGKQLKLLPLRRAAERRRPVCPAIQPTTPGIKPASGSREIIPARRRAASGTFEVSHFLWRGLAVGSLIFIVLLLSGTGARAQESRPSEYDVKAAFLLNFAKFVEWPTNAFADAQAPLVIGVLNSDPFRGGLQAMVAGRKIRGRPVTVRILHTPAEATNCHVLFIPAAARKQIPAALEAVRHTRVLTVGETPGFCEAGGMIDFVIENHQVHFDINNKAAQAAGLKISSKLLTLARRLLQ